MFLFVFGRVVMFVVPKPAKPLLFNIPLLARTQVREQQDAVRENDASRKARALVPKFGQLIDKERRV